MPRGGARPGSGPKKGAQYNRRWRLEVESAGPGQKPTAAQRTRALRRQICLCAADGMSVETIAAVLGFSVDKLKALFRRELQFGREIIRAEELARMGEQSAEGKLAATKSLLEKLTPASAASGNKRAPAEMENDRVTQAALKLIKGGRP